MQTKLTVEAGKLLIVHDPTRSGVGPSATASVECESSRRDWLHAVVNVLVAAFGALGNIFLGLMARAADVGRS